MARSRSARRLRRVRNKERREQRVANVVAVDESRAARRRFEFQARGGLVIKFDFTEEAEAVVEVDAEAAGRPVISN